MVGTYIIASALTGCYSHPQNERMDKVTRQEGSWVSIATRFPVYAVCPEVHGHIIITIEMSIIGCKGSSLITSPMVQLAYCTSGSLATSKLMEKITH